MATAKHYRLALLMCDTPFPSIKAEYGDYRQIFETLLTSSLAPINASQTSGFLTFPCAGQGPVTFTLDGYDVVTEMAYPPDETEYDGLLLSGSAASAYENVEWINKLVAYVKRISEEKPQMKIFGICFGHQIIARALGGSCVPNNGLWEVAVINVQLSALGKAIFGTDDLDIQQMHRDHVPTAPPNSHLLGSTTITPNQGMVIFNPSSIPASQTLQSPSPNVDLQSIHILTLQGHPEFTPPIMEKLLDARIHILGEEITNDARKRAGGIPGKQRPDGRACGGVGTVGKAIWGVLGVA
ncbi:hypothetical protein HYDPIDRAFT_103337 [Hydnomerulius pinastri MD-312]|uniref:Glutamine amidotransferase domain-containing protein n=1 Tax=Hydnomerulius pinastri MD-312 TaxID=994086 RepID=A0A0C9W701_9AGAM|nr:hypothetical protein HYDPIDRAFT_103337 [Hydnomerulius pinastri MD-312]